MKLAESCVIEQHIERLLKGVEPTNLGLGTPDVAAHSGTEEVEKCGNTDERTQGKGAILQVNE